MMPGSTLTIRVVQITICRLKSLRFENRSTDARQKFSGTKEISNRKVTIATLFAKTSITQPLNSKNSKKKEHVIKQKSIVCAICVLLRSAKTLIQITGSRRLTTTYSSCKNVLQN
jgi:hypothetical protein